MTGPNRRLKFVFFQDFGRCTALLAVKQAEESNTISVSEGGRLDNRVSGPFREERTNRPCQKSRWVDPSSFSRFSSFPHCQNGFSHPLTVPVSSFKA